MVRVVLATVFVAITNSLAGAIPALAAGPPVIYGVDPNSGPTSGGSNVAIFGSGFSGATSVQFGPNTIGQRCPAPPPGGPCFNVADDTRIFTTSAHGTIGTVDVTVTTPGGTSSTGAGDHFTYVAPAVGVVRAIDPHQGTAAGGTNVQVFGSGFSSATSINFGSVSVTCSSTGFTPLLPAGPTGGGPGGPSPCQVNSDDNLFVTTPAGTTGTTVDITVVNSAGTGPSGPGDRFTYLTPPIPAVNAVGPNHGTAAGGDNVQIFGSGLSGATSISFGSTSINRCPGTGPPLHQSTSRVTRVGGHRQLITLGGGGPGPGCFFGNGSDNNLGVQSPPGTVGTVHVTVNTPAGTSAPSIADQFIYDPIGTPAVYALSPSHGTAAGGVGITIIGRGFTGATSVHIGTVALSACGPGTAGCFTVNGDQAISAITPFPAGPAGTTVDVTVTTPLGTSASGTVVPGDKFTLDAIAVPAINAIDPTHGPAPGNTNMTLYGSGFANATSVHFGATAVPPCPPPPPGSACFNVGSDSQIFLNSPGAAAAGSVAVTVTTSAGTSGSTTYTYDTPALPAISGVSPSSGPTIGGTTVYISGSGFSGATSVTFNGNSADFNVLYGSDTMIQANSPPGTAGAAIDIRVSGPGGTSAVTASDHFTYVAPTAVIPTVTGVGPATAPSGTSVFISGSGFSAANGVTFGTGHPATGFGIWSDNLLQATAPAGTGTVDVQVSTTAGTSAVSGNDHFTYGSAPTGPNVFGLNPNHGTTYGGTYVSVQGTGFTGASTVTVGTSNLVPCGPSAPGACFNVNGDGNIFVQTPSGSLGAVDIRVSVGTTTSPATSADLFNYQTPVAPVVNGIDPHTGPTGGNTQVTIVGSGFGGATSLSIGTTSMPPCSPTPTGPCFGVNSDSMIFTQTPSAAAAGVVDVTVTTPSGTSSTTTADQFTYFVQPAPAITRVSPSTGGSAGGTLVYISGTNLSGVNGIFFGPIQTFSQCCASSAGVISVYSPSGTASTTPVDITVTTSSGTSAVTAADHYTYTQSPAPTISGVAPNSGYASGGLTVYISGANLGGATRVSFGATNAFGFFYPGMAPDNNLIQTNSPPGTASATPVDVSVTTAGGTTTSTAADHFTYAVTPAPTVAAVSPASGPVSGGTDVFISGSGIENASSIAFGSSSSSFGFFSPAPNVLRTNSPSGTASATPVDVTVTTSSGTSPTNANDHFTYTATPAPVVAAVSPAAGPSGTVVWITGSNLSMANAVNFGGTTHPSQFFNQQSPGVIRANSPPSAASGTPVDITVVTPAGSSAASAADQYTYTAGTAPTITVIGPNVAQPGTLISITGTGLGGTTSISFGGVSATNYFIRSDTMVRVNVPPGSGTVDVRITTVVGTTPITAADIFTYPGALVVLGLSPNSGPTAGGTTVTLTGSGFTGATTVNFGSVPGTNLIVNSDTQLTVTSPAGSGTVDVTVVTPAGTSAVVLADQFSYGGVYSRASNRQYTLANSDGTSWNDLDSTSTTPLTLTVTPSSNAQAVISGNVDLWTSQAGYNQDLGINIAEASTTQYPGHIVAWKESGGFAGTFSPNAAYVQAFFPMTAGTTYHVKLQWKTNKNAPGATIWAGAGPWPSTGSSFSPSRLTLALVPAPGGINTAADAHQLTLSNSDGTTWQDMDSTSTTPLMLAVTPSVNSNAILSGNADLWTSSAGYNQDLGIYVQEANTTQYPGNIIAWKESGGFAGTFSPNAAFVQTVFPMTAGTTYHIKLQWKANKNASGATIWAGAGPWPSGTTSYSPTRLTALLVPASTPVVASAIDNRQPTLTNSDGNTWTDVDASSATPLTLTVASGSTCVAILTGNADLWTSQAGFNQDLGIYVQEADATLYPGHIIAWKESGGFAGTFSPNAAFVETTFLMTGGTTYHLKLQWKTNKNAPGATIWAGAGPWPGGGTIYSPTRLTAQLAC